MYFLHDNFSVSLDNAIPVKLMPYEIQTWFFLCFVDF